MPLAVQEMTHLRRRAVKTEVVTLSAPAVDLKAIMNKEVEQRVIV